MSVLVDDVWTESSLYDQDDWDDSLDWKFTLLPIPTSEFLALGDEHDDISASSTDDDDDPTKSPKYQIRYHDCMWSGRCVSHQDKTKCLSQQKFHHQQAQLSSSPPTPTIAVNPTQVTQQQPPPHIQQQQQQQQQNLLQINETQQQVMKLNSQQHIPAGTSLLLNSRHKQQHQQQHQQQQNRQQQCKIKIPNVMTADFLKERETPTELSARPDTPPLSLDDDTPEFKHTIDLAACTMGSNKMNLLDTISEERIIKLLKEHLEDPAADTKTDIRHIMSGNRPESLTDVISLMKTFPDFPEVVDEDEEDSAVEMDTDSESGIDTNSVESTSPISSPIYRNSSSTNISSSNHQQGVHHSDHSYTRCKNGVDVIGLGVQTPSDSEEEIDVVSVGDKNLPTNPSAKDRRALQTTVAHKISARIVKTAKGIKTIPPRRRCSDEESSYSSNITSPAKISSISPALISTSSSSSLSGSTVTSKFHQSSASVNNGRKRPIGTVSGYANQHTSSKRFRGKPKSRPSPHKRHNSDTDEAETIEKRNLHNDMERQRRIGLKNLFDELKKQIPSIRDKERAPKVNILREAATLCHQLNREHEEINALRQHQERLMARVKYLRTMAASQRNANCPVVD